MVKRKLTVGGLIGHLASVSHYHKSRKKGNFDEERILHKKPRFVFVCPACNLFLEYDPRFSVAPFQVSRAVARRPPSLS